MPEVRAPGTQLEETYCRLAMSFGLLNNYKPLRSVTAFFPIVSISLTIVDGQAALSTEAFGTFSASTSPVSISRTSASVLRSEWRRAAYSRARDTVFVP